jgi:AraC family transcriptional regulator
MVCDRCIMVVRHQLEASSIAFESVQLGEVVLSAPLHDHTLLDLKAKLAALGFELLDDRKVAIVTRIKSMIIKLIHQSETSGINTKLSVLLSESLNLDYPYLSALFSSIEGITIEKYVILQRIERVKELLAYNEMSLNEIAYNLGYSSVQHLSQQFKKITGLTPSQFKLQEDNQRKPLDQVGL